MFNVNEAARIIHHHYGEAGGLIDSLRPYTGRVDASALADTLAAVRAMRSRAASGDVVSISALSSVFHLTNTVRRWALDKDSMLVRNKRIELPQWEQLMDWVIEVESEYSTLLGVLEERESSDDSGPSA